MVPTSTSVHMVEKELPRMAAISVNIPGVSCSCLSPPWETLQTGSQQIDLAQAPMKLLLSFCPLEGAIAGSWTLGAVEQSQGEGCC